MKVKDGKKATLTFTDVRKFSLYQVYNEFNKKLNCDRQVIVIKPENYNKILKDFYKRTGYLEFEPIPEIGEHCQVAFNLCSAIYNKNILDNANKNDKKVLENFIYKNPDENKKLYIALANSIKNGEIDVIS